MKTLDRVATDVAGTARVLPFRVSDDRKTAATILVIDTEPLLADSIKYTFEREGYRVLIPAARDSAIEAIALERPSLVLLELDRVSPETLELCRSVRASTAASIILIAPAVSEADRARATRCGADGLIIKPFSMRELAHCVADQLRRERATAPNRDADEEVLRSGPVEMDVANHEVWVRGKLTVFPPKEFGLLETLLRSRGRLLTRPRLITEVWGADYYGDGKTLDTHVKRLREKIEADPRRPKHLIVVRGLGYRFVDPERTN